MKKKAITRPSILKQFTTTQVRVLTVLAVIVTVGILGYVSRGWLRVTIVPNAATMLHGQTLQRDMDAELAALQEPLTLLGYSNVDATRSKCIMQTAQGFRESLSCTSSLHAYSETPRDAAGKATLNSNAQKLQTLLQQRSWEGEYTDTAQVMSLTRLVHNLNDGIDYTPDAAYMKTIGNMQCIMDTTTAFSSPKPAAMSTTISCSRILMPFGHMQQRGMLYDN